VGGLNAWDAEKGSRTVRLLEKITRDYRKKGMEWQLPKNGKEIVGVEKRSPTQEAERIKRTGKTFHGWEQTVGAMSPWIQTTSRKRKKGKCNE